MLRFISAKSKWFYGVLGSFVVKPFCKIKDFYEHGKNMETHFYKTAQEAARLGARMCLWTHK